MKKILITGTGQFATNWVINKKNYNNFNLSRSNRINYPNRVFVSDITNFSEVEKLIRGLNPDVIINSTAITDINFCECNRSYARLINLVVPKNLSKISEQMKIPFVQISTDNFSSNFQDKRNEFVNPIPVNVYGETKISAEKEILQNTNNYIIIRTNFFGYSPAYAKSSLMKLIENFENKKVYEGFVDQFFNPISVDFLIDCIDQLLLNNFRGLINISGDYCISKHEFALTFLQKMDYEDKYLLKSSMNLIEGMVKRPGQMCLDNSLLKKELGILRIDFSDQIDLFFKNLVFKRSKIQIVE